jgi:GT2 family glycosyltransferase
MAGSTDDMRLSILIATCDGAGDLPECLDSLARQKLLPHEVIVVANGLHASCVMRHALGSRLKTIRNERNEGFARANVQALAISTGEAIVTVNDDMILHPDCLAELAKVTVHPSRPGMVAGRILLQAAPDRIDADGIELSMNGSAFNRRNLERADTAPLDEEAIFSPCAALALYTRKLVDRIGFFDPGYFAYYEDVDLGWRAQRAGFRCRFTPRAIGWHRHSASAGRLPHGKNYWVFRNRLRLVMLNWPRRMLLRNLPAVAVNQAAAALGTLLIQGDPGGIGGTLRAARELPRWRMERKGRTAESPLPPRLIPCRMPWQFHQRKRAMRELTALRPVPPDDRAGSSSDSPLHPKTKPLPFPPAGRPHTSLPLS